MKYLEVLSVLQLLVGAISSQSGMLPIVHRWKSPEFLFPDEETKIQLTANGSYVPNTGVLLDVDRHEPTDRTFVTLPHFSNGTSVTLAVVSDNRQPDNPLLSPYPDWSWHQPGNCDGLISVFRIKIDECNRLWVIDSGVVDVFGSFIQTCSPKIMVFDLKSNQLIKRYVIPPSNIMSGALFITIEVETDRHSCHNTFAYVADVGAFKLLVYNFDTDRSWLVNSCSFQPDPSFFNFTISGSMFQLQDGLFALTLSPIVRDNDRFLFYHSLASNCENAVLTSALKNESNFANGENLATDAFRQCFGRRKSQSSVEAMDRDGNLFFSYLENNSIRCWNWGLGFSVERNMANQLDESELDFNDYDFETTPQVVQGGSELEFPSGMKAIRTKIGDQIWIISCRFQLIATTGLNRTEYNFHILRLDARSMALQAGCLRT